MRSACSAAMRKASSFAASACRLRIRYAVPDLFSPAGLVSRFLSSGKDFGIGIRFHAELRATGDMTQRGDEIVTPGLE